MSRYKIWPISAISLLIAILVAGTGLALTPSKGHSDALKQQIAAIIRGNGALQNSKCGVLVKVPASGRILYSYHGQTPMIPASNQKVMTTATALDTLGPLYSFTTELVGHNPNKQGVIKGAVYLRGNGDPVITPPYEQPATAPFSRFIQVLKSRGVKVIDGDIVADDSAFDRRYLPQGWLERYQLDAYAAPVSALSFNGNLVEVIVGPSGIRLDPSCAIPIDDQRDGRGPLAIMRKPGKDTIIVQGQTPASDVRRQITVNNPPLFAASTFRYMLLANGIKHNGKVRLINTFSESALASKLPVYAVHRSVTLNEIVKEINHESDNLLAEHIFRASGAQITGKGTAKAGFQAVQKFLSDNGVAITGLKMVDGCGLSRLNRVSPAQLVGTLEAMNRHPYGHYYKASLPVSGKGTLRSRLGGVTVQAKTGTLANDSSLTGYVTTAAGQELVFSLIFNDVPTIWAAVETQDKIVRLLSTWPETF